MQKIEIHGIGSSGEGIGSLEGYTLFVEGALPGESLLVELVAKKKKYGVAKLLSLITPSQDRIAPSCPHFGVCGGCQIMHLAYSKQLTYKRQKVADALQRIGGFQGIAVLPCLPSPKQMHYRNKIQLPVQRDRNGLQFGLYKSGSHQLVPIDACQIHSQFGEKILQEIWPLVKEANISLRHLVLKSSSAFEEALLIFVTDNEAEPSLETLAKQILEKSPQVKGVVQNIHAGGQNVILGPTYKLLAGEAFISEKIGDLTFQISPASFFQVNPEQAGNLYEKALEWADLQGSEKVLDAYCGVGTLSLFFARGAKEVIGVEQNPQAIEDAKKNACLNRIKNARFVSAKAEEFIQREKGIDLLLINPPRKGCDPAFLAKVGKAPPKKILYISCDPATLARDLKELAQLGFSLEKVQPFDMFPQTAHVETIALLNYSPVEFPVQNPQDWES